MEVTNNHPKETFLNALKCFFRMIVGHLDVRAPHEDDEDIIQKYNKFGFRVA